MRKQRADFYLDTNHMPFETPSSNPEDPFEALVFHWFSEFRLYVIALADLPHESSDSVSVHEQLSDLERRICVVINEKDHKRVSLIERANHLAERVVNLRRDTAESFRCQNSCSVDTLRTVYKERNPTKRHRDNKPSNVTSKAIHILRQSLALPADCRHHLDLRRMNVSDANAKRLLLSVGQSGLFEKFRSLDLSQNNLSSTHVLIELLSLFPDVNFVDLRGNRFAETCDVIDLVEYISNRPGFVGVDLRGNLINISILSVSLWFHMKRLSTDNISFLNALGKIVITNNKTCQDILP
jgi:hypothetical protein